MIIEIRNLGKIGYAKFSLANLTFICGNNNAGKTYVTYAVYGFFSQWRQLLAVNVDDAVVDKLWQDGHIALDIKDYANQAQTVLNDGCLKYQKTLCRVFATKEDRFKDASFAIQLEENEIDYHLDYRQEIGSGTNNILWVEKPVDSSSIELTLMIDQRELSINKQTLAKYIKAALLEIVFSPIFPSTYIASTERTGAAIFRKELDFARNRLIEEIGSNATFAFKPDNAMALVNKSYQDYALPVKANVDFARNLESCSKDKSYVATEHPEILKAFKDIIGGEYQVKRDGVLYYLPDGSKKTRLSIQESSSSVRSLIDVGFYLNHEIKSGDLLMIDEPELNLHPSNQRRMARLFARLINCGIRVFVTTHSDYIVRELNALMMMHHNEKLKQLAKEEGYGEDELLDPSSIKIYIAKEASVKLPNEERKRRVQTLVLADIDPVYGVEVTSFDETIRDMNRIQDRIIAGIEEDV